VHYNQEAHLSGNVHCELPLMMTWWSRHVCYITLSGPHGSFKYSDTSSNVGVRRNYHSFFDKTRWTKCL